MWYLGVIGRRNEWKKPPNNKNNKNIISENKIKEASKNHLI